MSNPIHSGIDATLDINVGSPEHYPLDDSPIVISLSDDNVLGHGGYDYSIGSNVSVTGISIPWDTTTSTSDSYTIGPDWKTSAKIQLDGPDADIEINGESMIGMLRRIEERLNILKPNPELESEWKELRALGDAYRKLEAEIEAKIKTWNAIAK